MYGTHKSNVTRSGSQHRTAYACLGVCVCGLAKGSYQRLHPLWTSVFSGRVAACSPYANTTLSVPPSFHNSIHNTHTASTAVEYFTLLKPHPSLHHHRLNQIVTAMSRVHVPHACEQHVDFHLMNFQLNSFTVKSRKTRTAERCTPMENTILSYMNIEY